MFYDNKKNYNFPAFTLAEVVITLGIIGVIAALTIPSLIGGINKKIIEVRLKEDYSILQQVMYKAQEDDATFSLDFPNNTRGYKDWFDKFIDPNMKYANVCFNTSGCWHPGITRNLAGSQTYVDRPGIGVGYDIIVINMLNNSTIIVDAYNKGSIKNYFGVDIEVDSTIIIWIDANGPKGPNVVGKDIYALVYTTEGLVPAGSSETKENVDRNCGWFANGANAGYYCLIKVRENDWKIPDNLWSK